MSSINLGSIVKQNGRNTASGLISGLDSASLIEGILSARQASITEIEDKITTNNDKITALSDLQVLLDRFRTTADFLRNPPGVGNENTDFFKHTVANLVSSTAVSASTYLSITSQAGATINSYNLTDIVTAKTHQIRRDGFASNTASVVGNISVADNYQAQAVGSVAGTVLSTTAPITFSNNYVGNKASIDIVFGSQNQFDATDQLIFAGGSTTITFGGGGGDDVDISGAATVSAKLQVVADRMNSKTSGEEARYYYSVSGNTLTVTRRVEGSNAEVGTNMNIDANFSNGANVTQTIAIGSQGASNNPAGGALNSLGSDGDAGTAGRQAVLDVIFNDENDFDAADSITFGSTTITFGGTGGSDIDISSASSLDDKLDAIVSYMNGVASGNESLYTYSRDSSGIITITRDAVGSIDTIGGDITVTANFSKGSDTSQKVAFGRNYENNGSSLGSVAFSNATTSASVSNNGVDGVDAAAKATISLQFASNVFDANDQIVIGGKTITFGGGGANDITVGADLPETLVNIANYMNSLTSGDESGYVYTTNGTNSLVLTRKVFGDTDTINNNLSITANLSDGDTTNTVAIGSQGASNTPAGGYLDQLGTDGVNRTVVPTAKTTFIESLSGAISIDSALYIAGTSSASSFTPNTIEFRATVGGVTYTSKPVVLQNGSVGGAGGGANGLGNTIPSGTVITFVKDTDTDSSEGTEDITFRLVIGAAQTVNNSAGATTLAGNIDNFLNVDNTITITQNPEVPPLRAGTFTLGGVEITLDEGDSLNNIKSKINAVSETSGVVADVVKVADGNYSLILKSKNTGIDNKIGEYGDGDAGDPLSGYLQFGSDSIAFTQVQAARDSSITIDGLTITRSSNSISDALSKVTFNLISDTPNSSTEITADITSDNDIVKSGIEDFINAYNELKFFISKQSQKDENNNLAEGAVLGNESILSNLLRDVESELSRTVNGIMGSNPNSLFAVGISTIDFPGNTETPATKNIFVLDESKFNNALTSDFEALRNVFSFNFQSNSSELSMFKRSNSTSLMNFKLDIDTSRANGQQVRVLDQDDNFLFYAEYDSPGRAIKGIDGTALAGLVLVYTGDGTDNVTVNMSHGIADRVYNTLDKYLKDGTGVIETTAKSFSEENKRFNERIAEAEERLSVERDLLVDQFSRLETIISQANQIIGFLEAQRQSLNANNN